ncbi:MAG TPA: EF-P lysine aminoacylase EpmA [Dehalococcoidales bacterium]|nr:EF-P lysine aminoacylase EpmA [Dehalococcoidales bacterium]
MPEEDLQRLARIRSNLERRAVILGFIRGFFNKQDFLEVETPVRVPVVAPEPYIIPIESDGWYLSTSPELHMKRLLAAGYERLFQFSRCFRKGERGRWHNPEFTMLEWYRAGADYNVIIHDMELIFTGLAKKLGIKKTINYNGSAIDISLPWPRITVRDAYRNAAGWDPVVTNDPRRFDIDFIEKVLPSFSQTRPTVLIEYPSAMAALARLKPGDSAVAERSEIFMGGLELANIYSELAEPQEQEKRFKEALEEIRRDRGQKMAMPQKFMAALPKMPLCGGVALGIDRLVMLFCDASSIDEVMAFTHENA